MDVSMECGTCGGTLAVDEVPTLEQVHTLAFGFWAAHEHPDWMFETTQKSKGGAYANTVDDDDEGDE